MSSKPFFSVIIPTYNRKNLVLAAIDSVLRQTFHDWELIIIDDGSTDGTFKALESITDSRISAYFQDNRERSASRNRGINLSKGKFICFLDSDDLYLEDHLGKLHQHILSASENKKVYHTGYELVDLRHHVNLPKDQNGFNRAEPKPVPACQIDKGDFVDSLLKCTVYPSSTCIHKDILENYSFREDLRMWEDTFLWLCIAKEYAFEGLEQQSVQIKLHRQSTTAEIDASRNAAQIINEIERKCSLLRDEELSAHVTSKHIQNAKKRWLYHAYYNAFLSGQRSLMLGILRRYFLSFPEVIVSRTSGRMVLDLLRA